MSNAYISIASVPEDTHGQDQPPFFIQISRKTPSTVTLSNPVTDEVLYTVRDTGRSSLSSKPDYEIFRQPSDLFVSSLRFGKKGTEVKFQASGKKVTDIQKFNSAQLTGDTTSNKLTWKTTKLQRAVKGGNDRDQAKVASAYGETAVIECVQGDNENEDPICVVRLYTQIPQGRIEIWTKEACIDIGGNWDVLDELVTLAYAHMETSRRKLMNMGADQYAWSPIGLTGMTFGGGAGI